MGKAIEVMHTVSQKMRKAVTGSFFALLAMAGCATHPALQPLQPSGSVDPGATRIARPGDKVDIRFLCRLQNGDVVAAADWPTEQLAAMPKSPLYMTRDEAGPLSVDADASLPKTAVAKETAFEDEIVNRLARTVVGMKDGEERRVELTATELPERKPFDYVIDFVRVRTRPKEMRMSVDEYRSRTHKTPEVGQPFAEDPSVQGRVASVSDEEVVIRFSARAGDTVETPFGPGHIRETESAYEIVIDARVGTLIRSGNIVGRIVKVDEKNFVIDYRHPFGYETLGCDVAIEKVSAANTVMSGAGK